MINRLFPSNKNKSHGPCLSPLHEERAGINFTAVTRQPWMRKQLQPGDEKSPSRSHQAGVEPQHICLVSKLTCFSWEGDPCILATILKEKSWTFMFLWAEWILYLSAWWHQSIQHNELCRRLFRKAYPIASVICQQLWLRSSVWAVVLDGGHSSPRQAPVRPLTQLRSTRILNELPGQQDSVEWITSPWSLTAAIWSCFQASGCFESVVNLKYG